MLFGAEISQNCSRGTINPATGRLFRGPIIIYDPVTGHPFPNNIIPQNRLHPGSTNVIEKYVAQSPIPAGGSAGLYRPGGCRSAYQHESRISAAWITTSVTEIASLAGSPSTGRDELRTIINPNLPVFVDSNVTNLATSWVHTFSQSMINELRVGFQYFRRPDLQSAY